MDSSIDIASNDIEIIEDFDIEILNLLIKKYQRDEKYQNIFEGNRNIIYCLQEMWEKYSDRKFMLKLYKELSDYLIENKENKFLDIGTMNYNLICKDLLDKSIEYTQVEYNTDNTYFNNDILLKCKVQEIISKYSEYKNYFNVVCDFGVLGAPGISSKWNSEEISLYIFNILYVLKNGGIYIIKIDRGYFDNNMINFEKYIIPYFKLINFKNHKKCMFVKRKYTGRRQHFTERDQYKFYVFQKI